MLLLFVCTSSLTAMAAETTQDFIKVKYSSRDNLENHIESLLLQLDAWDNNNNNDVDPTMVAPPQEAVVSLFAADATAATSSSEPELATTAVAAAQSTLQSPKVKLGEEELSVPQRKTLICIAMIVVSGIVLISIVFDKAKEFAEEHIIDVLEPILQTMFGELTILGFIGLIMFTVSKFGKPGLDYLACQVGLGWVQE